MGRRIFGDRPTPSDPEEQEPTAPERVEPGAALIHAHNAAAQLRSILRDVESADVREAVLFALGAWEERIADLDSAA